MISWTIHLHQKANYNMMSRGKTDTENQQNHEEIQELLPILGVALFEAHPIYGPNMIFIHPPLDQKNSKATHLKAWRKEMRKIVPVLGSLALPDTISNTTNDFVYFMIPSNNKYYYGVGYYACKRMDNYNDSGEEFVETNLWRSVALISRVPCFGSILVMLQSCATIFLEQNNEQDKSILVDLYNRMNASKFLQPGVVYDELLFNLEYNVPSISILLKPQIILKLIKAIILESRIAFVSNSASTVSSSIIRLVSFIPGSFNMFCDCIKKDESQFQLEDLGLPLDIFPNRSALLPFASSDIAEHLLSKKGFVVGFVNKAMVDIIGLRPDIIVDLDDGSLRCLNEGLKAAILLTNYDIDFVDEKLKNCVEQHTKNFKLIDTTTENQNNDTLPSLKNDQNITQHYPVNSDWLSDNVEQSQNSIADLQTAIHSELKKTSDLFLQANSQNNVPEENYTPAKSPTETQDTSSNVSAMRRASSENFESFMKSSTGWIRKMSLFRSFVNHNPLESMNLRIFKYDAETNENNAADKILDSNWSGSIESIQQAFNVYITQFCSHVALAAGPERSITYVLNSLDSRHSLLKKFGNVFIRRWTLTHNFSIWLKTHSIRIDTLNLICGSLKNAEIVTKNYRYYGQISQKKRCGQGFYIDKNGSSYEGQWLDDMKHGTGAMTVIEPASMYSGQWKSDKKHGEGHLYSKQGRYWGTFADDKFNGQGLYVLNNGDSYEGYFKDGQLNGPGKYILSNRETYSGDWRDGSIYGKGIHNMADGSVYVGDMWDKKAHGEGTVSYPDASSYSGQWVNGLREGAGIFSTPKSKFQPSDSESPIKAGATYRFNLIIEGVWYKDYPDLDETWIITFPNGDKFTGYLQSGLDAGINNSDDILPNGHGIYKSADGRELFQGLLKNGVFNGYGEYMSENGTNCSGLWIDGKSVLKQEATDAESELDITLNVGEKQIEPNSADTANLLQTRFLQNFSQFEPFKHLNFDTALNATLSTVSSEHPTIKSSDVNENLT